MPFTNDSSVAGMKITNYLAWANISFDPSGRGSPTCGLLALPPIQRSTVWNARQVVDSWDSVLRGLPIGAFTLQKRRGGELGRGLEAAARNKKLPVGWDLLDGQQRTRSLLLGFNGPSSVDQRCLWIDLDSKLDRNSFDIRLTSASQPFGYEPNGRKLSPSERQKARERFEPEGSEIVTDDRPAFSHELFNGFVAKLPSLRLNNDDQPLPPSGYPENWPPIPAGIDLKRVASAPTIMPLHLLLQAWVHPGNGKEEALARLISPTHYRFNALCEALERFLWGEIALVNASFVDPVSLPALYDRIGAGGTALSVEERLFSFYKSERADFHDIVCDINETNGRVMLPSKIAASAIRISIAMAHHIRDCGKEIADRQPGEGNRSLTDVSKFAQMLRKVLDGIDLKTSLNGLVGLEGDDPVTEKGAKFTNAFGELFTTLKYDKISNPLGLPTVLLWRLSPDLVQTLLFWRLHTEQNFDEEDNNLLRFVIFWMICIRFDDQSSNICFRLIREVSGLSLRKLFDSLRKVEWLTRKLVSPSEMKEILVKKCDRNWRSQQDRVGQKPLYDLVDHWWNDKANLLPWLQRDYLASAFPGYDPTADRDDDTPYDVDHMVPYSHWGFDWRHRDKRLEGVSFTGEERDKFGNVRGQLGNSIGNKWLVDYSTNRRWSNSDFQTKLEYIKAETRDAPRRLLDVFPEEVSFVWERASPRSDVPTTWTDEKLSSFQYAVEHRAAWLYKRLFEDIGFAIWEELTSALSLSATS